MEMIENDFGTLQFTFNNETTKLKYLVFMEKFYAMVKKDSNLVSFFVANPDLTAHVKVLKADNEKIVDEETNVKVEVMDQESRIAHVYKHLDMVKNNYFEAYDTSLTAIRCILVES